MPPDGTSAEARRGTQPGRAALSGAAPEVLWLDDPARPEPLPGLCGDARADLLVVGGGYTGLWTALRAKERDPGRDVVLLEAGRCGDQASGRNGGFASARLTHGFHNGLARWPDELTTLDELGARNLADISDTVRRYGIDCRWEETGELLVATPFQTAGYLVGEADRDGEDDPNEGRFVADPEADAATNGSATRFYRTGDIVRRDAQGRLFLEGRTDFQVKVRGTRVNTADVEQALLEHDDVVEAAVVALPDPLAGHLLHAVLRRAPGATLNSLVLRKHCAERLPLAAIPTTLRLADEPLPRTSTGKVDRRRVSHALADRP